MVDVIDFSAASSSRLDSPLLLLPLTTDKAADTALAQQARRILDRHIKVAFTTSLLGSLAACVAPGTLLQHALASALHLTDPSAEPVAWAQESCGSVGAAFVNPGWANASVFVIPDDQRPEHRELMGVIQPRTTLWFRSPIGTTWEMRSDDAESPAVRTRILSSGVAAVVRNGAPPLADSAIDWAALRARELKVAQRRAALAAERVPRFTATGFAALDIPPRVWAWLDGYYYDQVHRRWQTGATLAPAESRMQGTSCEFWNASSVEHALRRLEAQWAGVSRRDWHARACGPLNSELPGGPSQHLQLPPPLIERIVSELAPTVASWAGVPLASLVPSAAYGLRLYNPGATLDMHVDRRSTHVLAGVLNVAQEGMEAAWPFEIVGHDGALHRVVLQPGQMLLFEAARCLHGRPSPLRGERFVNFFVHYMLEDMLEQAETEDEVLEDAIGESPNIPDAPRVDCTDAD